MEDGSLHEAAVWSDLKAFDGRAWRGIVDIVVAGYPCQPFSCAGKQRGAKDPRHLWPHVARVIRECRPSVVFLENVENHLRIGYEQVRGELRGLDYEVEEGIFSAEEIGAPHLRKRLFILAYSDRAGLETCHEFAGAGGSESAGDRSFELADATERGRGELRESSGFDGFVDGCDSELGNAAESDEQRDWTGESDARLADRRPGAELEDAARDGEHGSVREDGGRRRGVRETGDELADAEGARGRLQSEREAGTRRRTQSGGSVQEVADPGNGLVSITRRRSGGRTGTRPAGTELADAERSRCGRLQGEGLRTDGRSHEAARFGDGGEDMADAYDVDGRRAEDDGEARRRGGFVGSDRVFPPGPDDFDGWRELLRWDATLEPALRGNADGASSRVDRLRACGNGVVPLVAAYAFRSLTRSAFARWDLFDGVKRAA